ISRTRNTVLRIKPPMIAKKNTRPKKRRTRSRQLRMIQLPVSATAAATRPMPRIRKKTIFFRRPVICMAAQGDGTAAGQRILAEIFHARSLRREDFQLCAGVPARGALALCRKQVGLVFSGNDRHGSRLPWLALGRQLV